MNSANKIHRNNIFYFSSKSTSILDENLKKEFKWYGYESENATQEQIDFFKENKLLDNEKNKLSEKGYDDADIISINHNLLLHSSMNHDDGSGMRVLTRGELLQRALNNNINSRKLGNPFLDDNKPAFKK